MKTYLIIGAVVLAIVALFWAANVRVVQAPGGPVILEARVGQEVGGLDVRITPLELLEDSRCPIDVQCIWAGTVRVRASLTSGLGTAMQEFKLGEPITTEAETVTLTEVSPAPRAGVKIGDTEYVFTFEVAKRATDTL